MKRYYLPMILILCVLLTACGHEHQWQAATCSTAKICSTCGQTEGEALGHIWVDATCTEGKYCSVCLQVIGEPLGHNWLDATCTQAQTCSTCKAANGSPLGHTWEPATCTLSETCRVCAATQGEPLGHAVEVWSEVTAATCTEEGTETGICTVCGESCERSIALIEHTPSEWISTVAPTKTSKGTRVKNCTVCAKELESEQYELTPEELAKEYKESCQKISYDSLARTPGNYKGQRVKFSGKVVQVCSEATSILYYSTYRVATSGNYNNVVYIYVDNYGSGERILEDDRITFYGEFDGLYTYKTVRGDSITIPSVKVEYID